MFSDDQELYSSMMYYQDDPHAQKTHTQLLAADPNFGFQGDVLKISMDELDLSFSQDDFGLESTNTAVTGLGAMGMGATTGFGSNMTELVDSLLPQEDSFPLLNDDYTASLDLTTIQLDSLDMAGPSIELPGLSGVLDNSLSGLQDHDLHDRLGSDLNGGQGQARSVSTVSQEPPRSRRPRRSTRAAAAVAAATLAQVMQDSADPDYPAVVDLGLTVDEAARRRQPKVSYSTLTEQEKQQRIRELNNVASRIYREKKGKQLSELQQEEVQGRLKNQQLRRKVEELQQLRDQMKEFTETFMRQHIDRGVMSPHISY